MIRHLHDVAGLEPLEQVAREHDVDIIAHGGLARRLFELSIREPDATSPDLFDLLPFTADIDLTHTGGLEATNDIMRAIREAVPLAECFRWELRSAAEAEESRAAREYGPRVPIHAVTLGVMTGFYDAEGARDDVDAGRHRYVRNPAYRESPRFREGRDLEVFGAIRYLRTVLEDDTIADDTPDVVRATFGDAMTLDTLGWLQESVVLRTRLHRLLKSVTVEARTPYHRDIVKASGLRQFVDYIEGVDAERDDGEVRGAAPTPGNAHHAPFHADLDLLPSRALVASAHVRGDLYRLPPHIRLLSATPTEAFGERFTPVPLLRTTAMQAPGISPLRVSVWTPIVPGEGRDPPMDDGVANEMIHLALVAGGDEDESLPSPADEDISVTMLFQRRLVLDQLEVAAPLATCVSRPYVFDDGRVSIQRCFRISCGNLLDRVTRDRDTGTLETAFVISARTRHRQDPESESLRPKTLIELGDYDERLVTS